MSRENEKGEPKRINLHFKERPLEYPSNEEIQKARQEQHKDHVDWFYGNYWCIYIDNNNKHFIEHDIGHFATKFITAEITEATYNQLKADPSRFDEFRAAKLF